MRLSLLALVAVSAGGCPDRDGGSVPLAAGERIRTYPPFAIGFGGVRAGDTATAQVTIANGGDTPLRVGRIRSDHADFEPSVDRAEIPPGDALDVEVRFTPKGPGVVLARLLIESDDASRPTTTLALGGTGVREAVAIEARPFAIASAGGLPTLHPDGIFLLGADPAGNPRDVQRIGLYLKNTSDTTLPDLRAVLRFDADAGIRVVDGTARLAALEPGVPTLLVFEAGFGASRVGYHALRLDVASEGRPVADLSREIFVARVAAAGELGSQPPYAFVAEAPEGRATRTLTRALGGLELTKLAPLAFRDVIEPAEPYRGTFSPLPFGDPPWKLLAGAAAGGFAIAAGIDGLCGKNTQSNIEWIASGLLSVAAVSDGDDAVRRGEAQTAPGDGERTVRESVDVRIADLPDDAAGGLVGVPFTARVDWTFTRELEGGGRLTHSLSERVRNDRGPFAKQLDAEIAEIEGGRALRITASLAPHGQRRLAGPEAFLVAAVDQDGDFAPEIDLILRDDGRLGDAVALDGTYTGTYAVRESDPSGGWHVYLFAQDLNLAPASKEPLVTSFAGGVGLAVPDSVQCELLPDARVEVAPLGRPRLETFPPYALGVGSVRAGGTGAATLTLANTGSADLVIESLESDDPAFRVESTRIDIPPGEAADVEVGFAPEAAGARFGRLRIASNDPARPAHAIALGGRGVTTPVALDARPFALLPAGELPIMSVDGIAVIGPGGGGPSDARRLGLYLRNTGESPLAEVEVRLEARQASAGIEVVDGVRALPALPPGVPTLLLFELRFDGTRPGKHALAVEVAAGGRPVASLSPQIFVARASAESDDLAQGAPDGFAVEVPQGTLRRAIQSYVGGGRLETSAAFASLRDRLELEPYQGTHAPIPFGDPAWKVAGAAAGTALLVSAVADVSPCEGTQPDAGTGAKLLLGFAGWGVALFTDGRDLFRRGEAQTPPPPGARTVRELVEARVSAPSSDLRRGIAGVPFSARLDWRFTRRLANGEKLTHEAREVVHNLRGHTTRQIRAEKVEAGAGPALRVEAELRAFGRRLLRGHDAYVFASLERDGDSGGRRALVLRDDGRFGDAEALDGVYSGRAAATEDELADAWRVHVFAQDVNRAPLAGGEAALDFVGGIPLAAPEAAQCRLVADAVVE